MHYAVSSDPVHSRCLAITIIPVWKSKVLGNLLEERIHGSCSFLSSFMGGLKQMLKNDQCDATLHHDTIPTADPLCPVQAAAHDFIQICICYPTKPNVIISIYVHNSKHMVTCQMATSIQCMVVHSMIWWQSYDLKCIGPHFLWASGAMQLKLNRVSDSMIHRLGHWRVASHGSNMCTCRFHA